MEDTTEKQLKEAFEGFYRSNKDWLHTFNISKKHARQIFMSGAFTATVLVLQEVLTGE